MQRTGGSMVEKVYPIDKALSSIFSTKKEKKKYCRAYRQLKDNFIPS